MSSEGLHYAAQGLPRCPQTKSLGRGSSIGKIEPAPLTQLLRLRNLLQLPTLQGDLLLSILASTTGDGQTHEVRHRTLPELTSKAPVSHG